MRSVHRIILVASILGVGATLSAQVLPGTKPPSRPQTYGNAAVSYLRVPAAAFFPINSADGYTGTVNAPRYGPQNINTFQAPVQLPSGAKPVSLVLDSVDINPIIDVLGSLVECDALMQNCGYHPAAGGGDPDCTTAGYVCSGFAFQSGAGSQSGDLSPDNMTINNADKFYMLVALTAGNQGAIIGMRVGYVLQVSPAPAVAFFNDVPTSDFGFQFVEAFAAAGITVGCTSNPPFPPPVYCPDRNVTRREMAIFFAKALGLQWP